MKTTREQRQATIDSWGLFPGVSVSWDPGLGQLRYGCVLSIDLDACRAEIVSSNGTHTLSLAALTARPEITDARRPKDTRPRLIRRPYVADRDTYWKMIEAHRKPATDRTSSELVSWAFDFISIHANADGTHSLICPMCLIERRRGMRRMHSERRSFPDFKAARRHASRLCAKLAGTVQIHIVSCC